MRWLVCADRSTSLLRLNPFSRLIWSMVTQLSATLPQLFILNFATTAKKIVRYNPFIPHFVLWNSFFESRSPHGLSLLIDTAVGNPIAVSMLANGRNKCVWLSTCTATIDWIFNDFFPHFGYLIAVFPYLTLISLFKR